MRKLIALLILASLGFAACAPEGGPNPLQPPTPRPAAPTEVARPPANPPSNPGNPPSGQPTVVSNPPSGGSSGCPDLDTMRKLAGVDVTKIGSEPCAWAYNRGDFAYKDSVNLPTNYMVTVATNASNRGEAVCVLQGNGGSWSGVKAATWRYLPSYPGLSIPRQVQLTKDYAPGAGYSPDIVFGDCSSAAPGAVAPATGSPSSANVAAPAGCPDVSGFSKSNIDGGCLYNASPAARFVVPQGWWANNNTGRHNAGEDLGLQSQVSVYSAS